jgi:hypothetical protein
MNLAVDLEADRLPPIAIRQGSQTNLDQPDLLVGQAIVPSIAVLMLFLALDLICRSGGATFRLTRATANRSPASSRR